MGLWRRLFGGATPVAGMAGLEQQHDEAPRMAQRETPQAAEFEVEKYRTDRAHDLEKYKTDQAYELEKYRIRHTHELELNKFTHALEVERLKILQLVNGGAFTVAVGFSGALLASDGVSRVFAFAAIVCWIAGLASAAWAAERALETQRKFTQAYNRRRGAVDSSKEGKSGDAARLHEEADGFREAAEALGPEVKRWSAIGVALFVAGALSMTTALALAEPSRGPPAPTASSIFG